MIEAITKLIKQFLCKHSFWPFPVEQSIHRPDRKVLVFCKNCGKKTAIHSWDLSEFAWRTYMHAKDRYQTQNDKFYRDLGDRLL